MKKLLITLLLLSTVFASTFAQGYDVIEAGEEVDFNHNEVYLSVGTCSGLGFIVGIFGNAGKAISDSIKKKNGQEVEESEDYLPLSFTAGYTYFFNETFGLGAYASYEKFGVIDFFTAQAKVTAQYGWDHFKFYQALSVGALMIPGSDISPIFDLTYLGLKGDFENFTVFLEASIPSTAFVKIGASYKF